MCTSPLRGDDQQRRKSTGSCNAALEFFSLKKKAVCLEDTLQ